MHGIMEMNMENKYVNEYWKLNENEYWELDESEYYGNGIKINEWIKSELEVWKSDKNK